MAKSPPLFRRRYRRVPVLTVFWVTWKTSAKRQVSRVLTLGLGGMFISTTDPPPTDTSLELSFEAPDGEIRTRAIVRNSIFGSGMGVEYLGISIEDRKRLIHLVDQLQA